MRDPHQVLIRPVITEKAGAGAALRAPQYSFQVATGANKVEIKRAVEVCFNVRVQAVNTLVVRGKRVRLRSPKMGKRPNWKKAVVTLEPGHVIELV